MSVGPHETKYQQKTETEEVTTSHKGSDTGYVAGNINGEEIKANHTISM